ncbi:hypothetical protein JKI95_06710 [Corynebacterium aquatimens]|nr:hypothetical protein [Corynebacterium aquatimens]QYH18997.1 hypothetical protein JKI95_06710 [Corynebacterium aquatimens]
MGITVGQRARRHSIYVPSTHRQYTSRAAAPNSALWLVRGLRFKMAS